MIGDGDESAVAEVEHAETLCTGIGGRHCRKAMPYIERLLGVINMGQKMSHNHSWETLPEFAFEIGC